MSARWAILPLVATLAAGAVAAPWHSNTNVDARSYTEMIAGVAAHGLPWSENGPVGEFAALQARWNLGRGDRLWSTYPPLFAYVMALPYRQGGVRRVIQLDVALLIVLALGIRALGRELSGSEAVGTASAYLALLGTPVWAMALDTSSYTLAITASVWSLWLTARAMRLSSRRCALTGAAAGFVGALAVSAHLGMLPILGATLLVLLVVTRSAASLAGVALPLVAMSALNRLRFGDWYPVSYGPCVWRSCAETTIDQQSVALLVGNAVPVLAWLLASSALVWWARRHRVTVAAVALSLFTLAASLTLRTRAARLALLAWGFVGDSGPLDMQGFVTVGGAHFLGPYVVKSLLQGSPILLLAVQRGRHWLLLPPAALLASLALRAPMSSSFALGFPFLHMRYLLVAMPPLAILTVIALRDLPWRRAHAVGGAAVALALGGWLALHDSDASPARRQLLLHASLVLAAATLLAYAAWRVVPTIRRGLFAATLATLALAYGGAVTLGVDLAALVRARNHDDARLDRIAARTPARFALIGWPVELDPVLALRATRDLQYADLYELTDLSTIPAVVAHWEQEGRPVYALLPAHATPSWPSLRLAPIDPAAGLYRVSSP